MEFTTLKTQSINLDIFTNLEKKEAKPAVKDAPIEKAITSYSEESLADLREHCFGILEKGEDASSEEIDSVHTALEEVGSLVKGEIEEDGVLVSFYYKEEVSDESSN